MKSVKKNGEQIPVEYLEESRKSSARRKEEAAQKTEKLKKSPKSKKHIEELEENLKKEKEKYDYINDQFLRLRAEFVNYRKRVEKEKIELADYIKGEMIKRLLPVLDDFSHMLDKSEQGENDQAILEGAKMIYSKFYQTLEAEGMKQIEALGKEFDPQFHEAMMMQNTSSKEEHNKILTVFQEGYMLKEKLLRPSKAVVGNFSDAEEKN